MKEEENMPEWIQGQGFYYVQSTGPIDEVENKKRMDELEARLQNAEERIEKKKALTA